MASYLKPALRSNILTGVLSGLLKANADGSLQAVVPSTVADWSATTIGSYPGSGQTWFNLVTTPADGESQTAYNLFLGTNGSPATNDPTFNGTAGTNSAFWTNDGGDRFTLAQANTFFLNSLHRTDRNQPFWMAVAGRMGDNAVNVFDFSTQTSGTTLPGVSMRSTTLEVPQLIQGDGTNAKVLNSAIPAITVGQDYILIFTFDPVSGQCRRWLNTFTNTQNANTLNTSTVDATNTLSLFLNQPADARLYQAAMGNAFLDDAGAERIKREYYRRTGRGFGLFPENTVAPSITGSMGVGEVLTADVGTWLNSPAFTYQWRRNGAAITGAINSTYTQTVFDVGTTIDLEVIGTVNGEIARASSSNSITLPDHIGAVVSGAVFEVDATRSESYDGVTQLLRNLITSPADGSLQTAYDFNFGATGSPSTDDPTFVGTVGRPDAYFVNDGGDAFRLAAANPTFLEDLHKSTNTTPFTFIYSGELVDQVASVFFMTTTTNTLAQGIRFTTTSAESVALIQNDGTSANVLGSTATVPQDTPLVLIVSYDPATSTVRYWRNTRTGTSAVSAYVTATGSSTTPMQLFRNLAAGSKFFAAAVLNVAIANDTDAGRIFDYENYRRGITFA